MAGLELPKLYRQAGIKNPPAFFITLKKEKTDHAQKALGFLLISVTLFVIIESEKAAAIVCILTYLLEEEFAVRFLVGWLNQCVRRCPGNINRVSRKIFRKPC